MEITENPFKNCRLPLEVVLFFLFGTEQLKFPCHLLHFVVDFGLLSAKKWQVPSCSVGLVILEKPLKLFSHRPNQFTLRNGKHLLHSKGRCY